MLGGQQSTHRGPGAWVPLDVDPTEVLERRSSVFRGAILPAATGPPMVTSVATGPELRRTPGGSVRASYPMDAGPGGGAGARPPGAAVTRHVRQRARSTPRTGASRSRPGSPSLPGTAGRVAWACQSAGQSSSSRRGKSAVGGERVVATPTSVKHQWPRTGHRECSARSRHRHDRGVTHRTRSPTPLLIGHGPATGGVARAGWAAGPGGASRRPWLGGLVRSGPRQCLLVSRDRKTGRVAGAPRRRRHSGAGPDLWRERST